MPVVGKKHYPYTKEGKKAAAAARKRWPSAEEEKKPKRKPKKSKAERFSPPAPKPRAQTEPRKWSDKPGTSGAPKAKPKAKSKKMAQRHDDETRRY